MAHKGHRHTGDMKRFGRRAVNKQTPLPICATLALPGTRQKAEVMRDRIAHGEAPFHPDDATDSDDKKGYASEDNVSEYRLSQGEPD